ncbi:MAG: transcription elongation factor GreA [Thermotogae bacterium]|nr:transcription elongation factor GreA [Thermotogota bacterium]
MKRKPIYLTREGYESLKREYEELRNKLFYDVAERIKEARELGDLSENSEYDEAKNEQGRLDSRIRELESILDNAEIIDEGEEVTEVSLGCKVILKNTDTGEERTLVIVNPAEADIFKGKVSVESPIGKGVLGKKVGDVVRVRTPKGVQTYKIMGISR